MICHACMQLSDALSALPQEGQLGASGWDRCHMWCTQAPRHGRATSQALRSSGWLQLAVKFWPAWWLAHPVCLAQGAWHGGPEPQALRTSRWLQHTVTLRLAWWLTHPVLSPQGACHGQFVHEALRPPGWLQQGARLWLAWRLAHSVLCSQGAGRGVPSLCREQPRQWSRRTAWFCKAGHYYQQYRRWRYKLQRRNGRQLQWRCRRGSASSVTRAAPRC